MSDHSLAMARAASPNRARVRHLDQLHTEHLCRNLVVSMPAPHDIARLVERAVADMPLLASAETIQRVALHNPDSFWAIRRATSREPSGFVAFLMLNELGKQALLDGSLSPGAPQFEFLAAQNTPPAAIYVWALHARGAITPALALVMDKLQSPAYCRADFIARAATDDGAEFLIALGFEPRHSPSGSVFFHSERRTPAEAGRFGMGRSEGRLANNRPRVVVRTAHSFDDLMQAFAIRSVVYVGDEECPFGEEFDGNDFSATHIVGLVGGEPAGCLRVRYFAGFAKLERLAVKSLHRGMGLGRELVVFASELCRQKGYRQLYIHSREDKTTFWAQFGFVAPSTSTFTFSDYRYIEMVATLSPHEAPVTLGLDPLVLNRQEGAWNRVGILEWSARRGARCSAVKERQSA